MMKAKATAPRGQHTAAFNKLAAAPSPTKPTHALVLDGKGKAAEAVRPVRRGELDGLDGKYTGWALEIH